MSYLSWLGGVCGAWAAQMLSAELVGRLLLRRLTFRSDEEALAFRLALGLGVWGIALLGLAATGYLEAGLLRWLTGLTSIAALASHVRSAWLRARAETASASRLASKGPLLVAGGLMAVLGGRALYPPVQWDAIAYHLVVARQMLAEHRLTVVDGAQVPLPPPLPHALYAWGMALRSDLLPQLLQATLTLVGGLALWSWGRRRQLPALGLAAAGIWLGSPLVLWLGRSAYVDTMAAVLALLGVYALAAFAEERKAGWWYAGMGLLGLAGGTKLTVIPLIACGVALGAWLHFRRSTKPTLAAVRWLAGCAAAGLGAGPSCLWIGRVTGDPFWPASMRWAHGIWSRPSVRVVFEQFATQPGLPKTFGNFLAVPVHMVAHPTVFMSEVGIPFMFAVAALPAVWVLGWGSRAARWWTGWALIATAFWFLSSQQARLWLSALPFVALALAETVHWGCSRLGGPSFARRALHGLALLGGTMLALFLVLQQYSRALPPPPERRDAFLLAGGSRGYDAAIYVRDHAQPGDRVALVHANWLNYYVERPAIDVNGVLERDHTPTFSWPADAVWLDRMERRGVRWILFDHADAPVWLKLPSDPAWRPRWPGFELVLETPVTWLYRKVPAPVGRAEIR